jgi:hypothetical protein
MNDEASRDHERHEGDWHEWSTDVTARNADGSVWKGELPRRLFVRLDADCLISCTITESPVTSNNPGARELAGAGARRLVLCDSDMVWLRDALTKAIDAKARYDESPDESTEQQRESEP